MTQEPFMDSADTTDGHLLAEVVDPLILLEFLFNLRGHFAALQALLHSFELGFGLS